MSNEKRKQKFATIPTGLVNRIKDLSLTNTYKGNAYQLCDIILRLAGKNDLLEDQIELAQAYFIKTFRDKNFTKWLNVLVEDGIIIRNNDYKYDKDGKSKGKCKSYGVNPELITKDLTKLSYKIFQNDFTNGNTILKPIPNDKQKKFISKLEAKLLIHCTLNKDSINEKNLKKSLFKRDLSTLKIDYNKLKRITNDLVDNMSIENFKVNEAVEWDGSVPYAYEQGGSKNLIKIVGTLDSMLKHSERMGLPVIQDMKRCLIMDTEVFISRKKKAIHTSYMRAIMDLEKNVLYAKRNGRNNRMDTNLTSLPTVLLKQIMIDNDLISIDLSNSQFAILADILKSILDTDDCKAFVKHASSGTLYEYVADVLLLEGDDEKRRKEAKAMCFGLLFSGHKQSSPNKDRLKKVFPSVFEWKSNFQKRYGDKEFPVMLQLNESNKFIDNIYCNVRDCSELLFTVHDSLVIKRSDEAAVVNEMTKFFNSIDMQCTLSITDGHDKKEDEKKITI